jgi:short-subunit dehydrogenase
MKAEEYFKDKVVIISGASGGIGEVLSLKLALLGSKIALVSRNEDKLTVLRDQILEKSGIALVSGADVSSLSEVQEAVSKVVSAWGNIDLVIACAGKYIQDFSYAIELKGYYDSMAINFFGTLNLLNCCLPVMKKQGCGHIVIINSLDAKKGILGDGPYVASKSALDGFGDVLRQEIKQYGIKVTSVYPGRVDTPMIQDLKVPAISAKIKPERVVRAIIRGILLNRATVLVPPVFFFLGILNNIMPRVMDWSYKILHLEGKLDRN